MLKVENQQVISPLIIKEIFERVDVIESIRELAGMGLIAHSDVDEIIKEYFDLHKDKLK